MNFFDVFNRFSETEKKILSIQSELEGLNGNRKDIRVEIMEDGMPKAMAFFDIDGTLAHLSIIHSKAIHSIFPDEDPKELTDTYFNGFKLGNSFREFDRMRKIYIDGHDEYKDPEFYFKNRFLPNAKEIDGVGNFDHEVAGKILKLYGENATKITDELYKNNPEEFEHSNITPIFVLARMFYNLGIPIVGFTANAKVFVDKLVKYLRLSDIFLDIATDETMVGGGKEIAIPYLINKLEKKGLVIPKDHLIFVGDSLRGDIGTELKVKINNKNITGEGILVLKDKTSLIQIKKQISEDITLKNITDKINVYGLMVDEVPLNEQGKPLFLSRFYDKFLEKL